MFQLHPQSFPSRHNGWIYLMHIYHWSEIMLTFFSVQRGPRNIKFYVFDFVKLLSESFMR